MCRTILSLIATMLLTACASNGQEPPAAPAAPTPVAASKSQPQQVIVTDANGMTVYVHDTDPPSKSYCNEGCAEYSPPVRPTPGFPLGGKFSIITRKDGTSQLAYDRRPLYTFKFDQRPGDTKGDGWQGIWHVLCY